MPPPLVSVLIPAFNAASWIGECIRSALQQTWHRIEVIVVDDGSTDRTAAVAENFARNGVRVIRQKNGGASSARNTALSEARGDYIQWLDADDILFPDKIERQLRVAQSLSELSPESLLLMSCGWGRFYQCSRLARYTPDALWTSLQPTEWLYRKVNENLWLPPECWLVSRRLSELAGPWDEQLFRDNDGDYFNRVVVRAKGIQFVPDASVLHRFGVPGISSNFTLDRRKLESLATSLLRHVDLLLSLENSTRTRSACLRLLDRWMVYFYPEERELVSRLAAKEQELGGQFVEPMLERKYAWLRHALGWRLTKRLRWTLPYLRTRLCARRERMRCRSA